MEITNAERVVFPEDGITKGDVVDYYRKASGRLVPYLEGRALTVERYPKGLSEKGFMQKNAPDYYPEELIRRHEVPKEDGGTTVYPVIESSEAVEYFANLGVITFHVPPSTADEPLHPDWVVWDLDPPEGELGQVREAAGELRSLLEGLGVPTMPMTSGSKGYHLRARLDGSADADAVAGAARGAAALAEDAHPDLMTTAFRKSERSGRVFVDWLRNTPISTAVAPWSLRARDGAPVATPLTWDEIESVDPADVRLRDAVQRLPDDPWSGMEPLDLRSAAAAIGEALEEAEIELEPFDRFRS